MGLSLIQGSGTAAAGCWAWVPAMLKILSLCKGAHPLETAPVSIRRCARRWMCRGEPLLSCSSPCRCSSSHVQPGLLLPLSSTKRLYPYENLSDGIRSTPSNVWGKENGQNKTWHWRGCMSMRASGQSLRSVVLNSSGSSLLMVSIGIMHSAYLEQKALNASCVLSPKGRVRHIAAILPSWELWVEPITRSYLTDLYFPSSIYLKAFTFLLPSLGPVFLASQTHIECGICFVETLPRSCQANLQAPVLSVALA